MEGEGHEGRGPGWAATGAIVAGGGLLLLVSLFLPWYRLKTFLVLFGAVDKIDLPKNAWQLFGVGDIALCALGASSLAIGTILAKGARPRRPWLAVLGLVLVAATVLVASRIVEPPPTTRGIPTSALRLDYGIFVALIGLIAAAGGTLAAGFSKDP